MNTPESFKVEAAAIFGVPVFDAPGKYLGLPSDWGRSKKKALAWFKDRISSKLSGWKEKLWSQAGKDVLLKSVIQAMPIYAMSIFKFPDNLCRELNMLISNFWWNKSDSRGIHWKAWNYIARPKCWGGLGFKDFKNINTAFLAKQAWRLILSPGSLWARVLKSFYFPTRNFWDVPSNKAGSWCFRSILHGRELLKMNCFWQVGNGGSINIWPDWWVKDFPTLEDYRQPSLLYVSQFISAFSDTWNVDLLNSIFPSEIVGAICKIQLRSPLGKDCIFWPFTKNGEYSVKSGTKVLQQSLQFLKNSSLSSSFNPPMLIWRIIWEVPVLPCIKHFLWCCVSEALPSRKALWSRKCATSPVCPICCKASENIEHILLLCPWAVEVWSLSPLNINIDLKSITRFESWFVDILVSVENVFLMDFGGFLLFAIYAGLSGRLVI